MSKVIGKRMISTVTSNARINNQGCEFTNCCNGLAVSEEEAALMGGRNPSDVHSIASLFLSPDCGVRDNSEDNIASLERRMHELLFAYGQHHRCSDTCYIRAFLRAQGVERSASLAGHCPVRMYTLTVVSLHVETVLVQFRLPPYLPHVLHEQHAI